MSSKGILSTSLPSFLSPTRTFAARVHTCSHLIPRLILVHACCQASHLLPGFTPAASLHICLYLLPSFTPVSRFHTCCQASHLLPDFTPAHTSCQASHLFTPAARFHTCSHLLPGFTLVYTCCQTSHLFSADTAPQTMAVLKLIKILKNFGILDNTIFLNTKKSMSRMRKKKEQCFWLSLKCQVT